jgi:2-isopropylmalate synthase
VFTAFSGSHQDAIRKGLEAMDKDSSAKWEVPYLTIDPSDIGRDYEPLVRINSQSGKGGIAFVLERHGGYQVPKGLAAEFSQVIQRMTDSTGKELYPNSVVSAFEGEYMSDELAYRLVKVRVHRESDARCRVDTLVYHDGTEHSVQGEGSGPIDAFVQAMNATFGVELHCLDYAEHALSEGEDAVAVAYVGLRDKEGHGYGVGKARDIVVASIHAVLSAVSRRESARGTTVVAA